MGYLDELRQASFRGFEFFVSTSQVGGGRRAVQHQYPNRETPYTEDMGRSARSYQLEGHVIGNDYLEAKRRLFEVFEKKGGGELIHPFYGSLMVQVSELNVSESIREGAIAVFTCTFLELGDAKFPKGINDKGSIVADRKAAALADAKADFDDSFSITGLPGFAVDSARFLVSKAQSLFDSVTKPLADTAEGIADLAFSTRNLVAEVNDLLQSPGLLSQRLLDSFQLMEDAIGSGNDKTSAYSAFFNFSGDEPVTGSTPTRLKEKENESAFQNFMRRVACISACQTALSGEYDSIDEAQSTRESITDVIEDQIRQIDVDQTNTDLLQSLSDLNASIVDALPDPDADLPSIKKITPENDQISLLLAYDLNDSLDNEQDIINRNKIRHPAFIDAGEELEVIGGNG